ncbi:hypothetical protein GCM10020358_65430 [Amorphoplanes nipponensis]|uniref:GH16 domain-containing protein n=1 Tax=Actinoplanes nipponensis TaxID=135950 RepID=A0A919JJE8_9ACTN|nr:glycoside hydrolase family 16 protein [Actinoplanes nipponensis]GIE51656.1 hypothetical protein Ani05nite_51900 [Actinoplanes nipponensis]
MIAARIVAGTVLVTTMVSLSTPAQGHPQQRRTTATTAAATTGADLVVNGTGALGTVGWSGGSEAGALSFQSISSVTGFSVATQGMQISRPGGTGSWAMALAALRSPETMFTVGKTYRMQAWVRDMKGSGAEVGMLLANGNYGHRPTEVSVSAGYRDSDWHLLSRTFVCTTAASSDTALYFDLPRSGAFTVQITRASVQQVDAPLPATVTTAPTSAITFAGSAGRTPSTQAWNFETGGNGWGNGELQTYTARSANAQLDGNGRLRIIARRETLTGADGITRGFTSARLSTRNKVAIAPGSYVETSITAPTGDGAWPAFWLLGTNIGSVGWPASGELDILEGWGTRPTVAFSAVHMGSLADPNAHVQYGWGEAGGTTDLGQPLDAKAHLYGAYFDANVVRFYIDRKPTMTIWAQDAANAGRAWPFGSPQYIVLNIAVPGETATTTATFPKVMTVGTISTWKGGVPFA